MATVRMRWQLKPPMLCLRRHRMHPIEGHLPSPVYPPVVQRYLVCYEFSVRSFEYCYLPPPVFGLVQPRPGIVQWTRDKQNACIEMRPKLLHRSWRGDRGSAMHRSPAVGNVERKTHLDQVVKGWALKLYWHMYCEILVLHNHIEIQIAG